MSYQVMLPLGYIVTDDRAQLDVAMIHGFLSDESYWAKGRTLGAVQRSIANSLCFGLYAADAAQAGFARVVTDFATMAHLSDVFVLPMHRGRGFGKGLVAAILAHPQLCDVRRFTLATEDAHGLYAGFGFVPLRRPETQMMRMVGEEPSPQA